jgi:hypothetical protein
MPDIEMLTELAQHLPANQHGDSIAQLRAVLAKAVIRDPKQWSTYGIQPATPPRGRSLWWRFADCDVAEPQEAARLSPNLRSQLSRMRIYQFAQLRRAGNALSTGTSSDHSPPPRRNDVAARFHKPVSTTKRFSNSPAGKPSNIAALGEYGHRGCACSARGEWRGP